jgi:predicted MFS family arabinose efflux permease
LANQLGIAVGFFLCPLVVPEDGDSFNITLLLLIESVVCIFAFLMVLFGFKSNPPTPPSRSAELQTENTKHESILQEIRKLSKDRAYGILWACFGLIIGAFYGYSTLIGQLLYSLGYENEVVIISGSLFILVGIVGAIIFGRIADKTKQYKVLTLICAAGTTVSMGFLMFVFTPDNEIMIYIGCSFLGLFMTALIPVGMDLGVEITYPLPEAIVSNMLMSSPQIVGIALIVACTPMISLEKGVLAVNSSFFAVLAAGVIVIFFFKGKNKRSMVEAQVPNTSDSSLNSTSSEEPVNELHSGVVELPATSSNSV